MIHARDLLYPSEGTELIMPTSWRNVAGWEELDGEEKMRLQCAIRRAYQAAYYRKNTEKFKAYQRKYDKMHREPLRLSSEKPFKLKREKIKMTFTASDILHATTEKSAWMIEHVLAGTRGLVT